MGLLVSKEDTELDIDEFLQQSRSFEVDPLEQEERCIDLVNRLKDIDTIRRLATGGSRIAQRRGSCVAETTGSAFVARISGRRRDGAGL